MDDRSGGDVLAAGTRLEEFEIERELGAGGFGVTYLAYDMSLDRRVAIKEYLPHDWGARGPDGAVGPRSATHAQDYRWGLDRFLEEARVLARLHHAHIVQVYRVIEAWGTAYMVTEYVEGRSLAEALRAEGPWVESRVLALLDALTAGLAEVHGAGLVHRDVKPANVMLRGNGSPVLIDFGSARQAVGGRSRSVTAVLTPGYAPFEQYSTKGVQGPWTDVYALGAVAYEALSGRVPEEAPERVAEDGLRPVSEVASQAVSAGLSSAVMSALALRREDRPRSLADWRGLLELPATGAAGDTGVRATPPPGGPSVPAALHTPARSVSVPVGASRQWRLFGVAAVAAVALAVVGLAWWGAGDRRAGRAGAGATVGGAAAVPGASFRDCDGCPEMVVIPAGEFRMGSPASEEGRRGTEGPLRRVAVGPFALGRHEVMRSEYAAFVMATGRGSGDGCFGWDGREWSRNAEMSWREPGFAQGGDHPAVCVSWRDAQAYAAWLSGETGKSYRLPSESEWEYAARAGTTTARYWGTGSDDQCGYANGADAQMASRFNLPGVVGCNDGAIRTASAGSYGANDFGLFDILGNVWEWVADCWHADYGGAPSDGSAWTVGGNCGRRVSRGGSWVDAPRVLRSAGRYRNSADIRVDNFGLRVARTLD